MKICKWDHFDTYIEKLEGQIRRGEQIVNPFPLLALCNTEALNFQATRIFAGKKYPASAAKPSFGGMASSGKIRIGYYSADFHDHATAYLMSRELSELHDKRQCCLELTAFSFGPDRQNGIRQRIVHAFDRFIDVVDYPDGKVAELSRELGIDIAVDLKGYTQDCRPGIFANRAAPIQVNYLGYPGSMGAEYFDYVIADSTIIPESNRAFFSEKIAYLPDTYQVNDTQRKVADSSLSRHDYGLPENRFVFCCFNNNYKITPTTFDSWSNILKKTDGSVLWLFEDNPWAKANLLKEASSERHIGRSIDFRATRRTLRTPRPPSSGGSVHRHAPLQRAYDGERCPVGRSTCPHLAGRDIRRSGSGQPAEGRRATRADHLHAGGI